MGTTVDLDVIKTILTVARTRNFSEAAYELSCSQSSVSRRVELAETELGIKIFTRSRETQNRGVHLTPEGVQAIPIMQRLMEDYQALFSIAGAEDQPPVTLHIGTRGNSMPPMAFSIIKTDFYSMYPHINLDIQFNSLNKLIFDLKNNRLDAVFFSCMTLNTEELRNLDQFRLRLLGKVPLSVGVSSDSALAKMTDVQMTDLKNETFLLQEVPGSAVPGIEMPRMGEFVEKIKKAFGFTPQLWKIEEDMLEIRYQLVKSGKGVFPSYTPAAWRSLSGITYLHLPTDEAHLMNYYLLSRSSARDHELRFFADYLTECISEECKASNKPTDIP